VDADGLVARRNVERHAATGKLDVDYVATLSADAVPALDRLPEPVRSCALSLHADRLDESSGGWGAANVARARARDILTARPATSCAYPPRRGDRRS
jgi:hypothetical protein